jgi:hypothetical protein
MSEFFLNDHVRIEHPLGEGDLHGVAGTVVGFTEKFTGGAWRDAYRISPDDPRLPGETLVALMTWVRPADGGAS